MGSMQIHTHPHTHTPLSFQNVNLKFFFFFSHFYSCLLVETKISRGYSKSPCSTGQMMYLVCLPLNVLISSFKKCISYDLKDNALKEKENHISNILFKSSHSNFVHQKNQKFRKIKPIVIPFF